MCIFDHLSHYEKRNEINNFQLSNRNAGESQESTNNIFLYHIFLDGLPNSDQRDSEPSRTGSPRYHFIGII